MHRKPNPYGWPERAKPLLPSLLVVCLISLVACAVPGAPQPPSLNLPKPVADLAAVRKGDIVTLSWTMPDETTDGATLRHAGKMFVWRTTGETQSSKMVGELPLVPSDKSQKEQAGSFKDSIADLLPSSSADFASYTVEAMNNSGKGAGRSNVAVAPLVPIPPPPKNVQIGVERQGVRISWNETWPPEKQTNLNIEYVYRIMRRLAGSNDPPIVVKELNAGTEARLVIDTGIQWEKQYQYWIEPVTLWRKTDQLKGEVAGDDSPTVPITTHDIFPPPVPSELQAVFAQVGQKSFIDLSWQPTSESELSGFNVYRRTEGTQPVKINSALVTVPAFRDDRVQPGMTYFYSVSAVSPRSNESARSKETAETVPR